jgi:hypothetical protein
VTGEAVPSNSIVIFREVLFSLGIAPVAIVSRGLWGRRHNLQGSGLLDMAGDTAQGLLAQSSFSHTSSHGLSPYVAYSWTRTPLAWAWLELVVVYGWWIVVLIILVTAHLLLRRSSELVKLYGGNRALSGPGVCLLMLLRSQVRLSSLLQLVGNQQEFQISSVRQIHLDQNSI